MRRLFCGECGELQCDDHYCCGAHALRPAGPTGSIDDRPEPDVPMDDDDEPEEEEMEDYDLDEAEEPSVWFDPRDEV